MRPMRADRALAFKALPSVISLLSLRRSCSRVGAKASDGSSRSWLCAIASVVSTDMPLTPSRLVMALWDTTAKQSAAPYRAASSG